MTSKMNVQHDICQMIIHSYVQYPTLWSYSAHSKGRILKKRDLYHIISIKRYAKKINIMIMSDCEQEILSWIGPRQSRVVQKWSFL